MPNMLAMQTEMFEKMSETSTSFPADSLSMDQSGEQVVAFQEMAEGMTEMFSMSDFTKTWTVRLGYMGLIVSILYILSGVFLLVKKPFSINLVYGALALSIVFSITESIVLTSDSAGGLMAMAAGFGNFFGIIIDIILLVVVVAMDKTAYDFSAQTSG